jgi:hypothetical protein
MLLFAVLSRCERRSDRRSKSPQSVGEQIVVSPAANALDDFLLSRGAGDNYERDIEVALSVQSKRARRTELGQRETGDDEVEFSRQISRIGFSRIHVGQRKVKAGFLQLVYDEPRIRRVVVEN